MTAYLLIKTLHVISSTILFGTGIGIAFFMYRSRFTPDLHEKYYAIRNTVIADYAFTLPAVLIQPLTGAWLIHRAGFDWMEFWLLATYALYVIVGICWLPVVWIQLRLKRMLSETIENNLELPGSYDKLFRIWILLGIPAFLSLLSIFYLMVAKPA